ncbi:hypothetical protein ACJX0J_021198, partial [Zea mays]
FIDQIQDLYIVSLYLNVLKKYGLLGWTHTLYIHFIIIIGSFLNTDLCSLILIRVYMFHLMHALCLHHVIITNFIADDKPVAWSPTSTKHVYILIKFFQFINMLLYLAGSCIRDSKAFILTCGITIANFKWLVILLGVWKQSIFGVFG